MAKKSKTYSQEETLTSLKVFFQFSDDDSYLKDKNKNYTHAFHHMLKCIEESSDKNYEYRFRGRFGLAAKEYEMLVQDVKASIASAEAQYKELIERIAGIDEELADRSKLSVYKFKKLLKEKKHVNHLLKNSKNGRMNIVFGGIGRLRKISKACNPPSKRDKRKNKKRLTKEEIEKLCEEYRRKRDYMAMYYRGDSNIHGNRYFFFDRLTEGILVFQPYDGKQINIKFDTRRVDNTLLETLSRLSTDGEMPITVRINAGEKYFSMTYDQNTVSGYKFDKKAYKAATREINRKYKDDKEECSRLCKQAKHEAFDKMYDKMVQGKVIGRTMGWDINSKGTIGVTIIDPSDNEQGFKIVAAYFVDMSELYKKLGLPSYDEVQKKQNNKRKHELYEVIHWLFRIGNHYKCQNFVLEDLDTKKLAKGGHGNRETNRKNNNLWNTAITYYCTARLCAKYGMKLIYADPAYTSFIGNIQHEFVDATNAAVEIARRGMKQYDKGNTFYPAVTVDTIRTVESRFGITIPKGPDDVRCPECTWVELYKASLNNFANKSDFASSLRLAIDDIPNENYQKLRMKSIKSKVTVYRFL